MGSVDCAEKMISKPLFSYDIKGMDWSGYLQQFSYIASGVQGYRNELNQALSDIDMRICDIMHYIEFYDLNEEDSMRMIGLLKEYRKQRRNVKDEIYRVDCFHNSIGTNGNISKAKESIKQINKLSTRIYHPRKLRELFNEHTEKKENRYNYVKDDSDSIEDYADLADTVQNSTKQKSADQADTVQSSTEQKPADQDNTTPNDTKHDHCKLYCQDAGSNRQNDWRQFMQQQAETYDGIKQHMHNVQADLNKVEKEIESMLQETENSNYNAAQGYNVFKNLKELQKRRKALREELNCLYVLTKKLDCVKIAESIRECIKELDKVIVVN